MTQEDIKRVVLKHPKQKFSAVDLSKHLNVSVNQIRVCMMKLRISIDKGWDDDIKYEEEKCSAGRRGVRLILFK